MKDMPITVKRSIELLGLCLLGTLFVIGQNLIMPLLMAFFISLMLLPVLRFFKKLKVPEVFAILLPILLLFIFLGLIVWFFSAQIGSLVADFPQIKMNVSKHLNAISAWIAEKFKYSVAKQVELVDEQSNKFLNSAGGILSNMVGSVGNILLFFGLLPIYIYLILLYKDLLLRFAFMWFEPAQHPKVEEGLRASESIIKSYLIGLLIQITYITVLLGGVLFLFGIKHALLIGVIFAFLNLIPYLGALIGNLLGVLITLASSQEILPIFTVLGAIAVVQFLDNNILMPRIVGSKVKINALASIVGVILAGAMCGVSGMFLALPMIAVLKIMFDRSEQFKQWGVLLGDERPTGSPMRFAVFRKKKEVPKKPTTAG
ncbi:AI-2E family transporter [Mucilaginibacter myungsuensis]|uniref:AI-2E family transporter n=1 Tax=Mucilaginibacter myungsuensis TaxID=649104 RepID=A0A929L5L2_9SPHI|nr:AI-2E family transporter [Mucilaginibacter myungsuensis]MBE9663631.1 AI-2E family transporter [Mucilaginibacter myungsuensis]MDN3599045.1 AI-2E family transporter [Mucilaginibacter myungsuensis]